jgi:deoxyadenosine/deoxycytidine kinase
MTEDQRVLVQELEAQGWVRRFTIEAERAAEYVELYESLGDEVRLEPVTPELLVSAECTACILAAREKYRVIYTRPGAGT